MSAPCQLEECIFIDLKASADTVVVDNLKIIPFFFSALLCHLSVIVGLSSSEWQLHVVKMCVCVLDQSIII